MPGTLMAPHPMLLMKSTGLVMFGAVGNLRFLIINQFPPRTTHLRRKSSSRGLISSFINKIWKAIWAVKISLSHSNKPLRGGRFFLKQPLFKNRYLVVYWNTWKVMESVRFLTRWATFESMTAR